MSDNVPNSHHVDYLVLRKFPDAELITKAFHRPGKTPDDIKQVYDEIANYKKSLESKPSNVVQRLYSLEQKQEMMDMRLRRIFSQVARYPALSVMPRRRMTAFLSLLTLPHTANVTEAGKCSFDKENDKRLRNFVFILGRRQG